MPYNSFIAQLDAAGTSPQLRMKAKRLFAGPEAEVAAEPAAAEDPSLALNPVFQPPEEQSLSLAGNAPVGSRGSSLASALLGNAPPAQEAHPAATERQRKRFEETVGGQLAIDYAAKKRKLGKGLGFLLPDFVANRNERDLAQALDLARAEMASEEGSERSAQWLMEHQERKVDAEARRNNWLLEDEDRDSSRGLREKELQAQREASALRMSLEQKKLEEDARQAREREAHNRKLLGLREAAATMGGGGQSAMPPYDVYADDPAATGVFSDFAKGLLKKEPDAFPEEVEQAKVNASRVGALPPMMSTPADRPVTATGPNGQKLMLKNGRWVPLR